MKGEQWPHSMWKWLGKLFPYHGASRIEKPQFQAPMWICERPRCFEKVPKIFSQMVVVSWMNPMVQSIPWKTNPREQNYCPTKPSKLNKPTPQQLKVLTGVEVGFFLPPIPPSRPPSTTQNHRPVRLQSPHWPCWCHIIAPNCSSKGSDQRTCLGRWK